MNSILLLHGALGAKEQFKVLSEMLTGSFDVHSISFSGHGTGNHFDIDFTIELFAKELTDYITHNNLAGINIFGYSMGGYAALYAASKQPELFGKIFTLATKFEWSPEIAARETKMLDAEKIKTKVPKFAKELALRHGEDNWENVLIKTAEMMKLLGASNPLTDKILSGINNEVQVGIGDSDKMVTLEETISAYRALPNAKLLVLPGTPHPLEQVNTNKLVYEIERFILPQAQRGE